VEPVQIEIVRVASDTGGGNQDITTTKLRGQIPKAAMFVLTYAITDGTVANHAVFSVGAATAVAEQWVVSVMSENNVGTTESRRRGATDECVMILNPAGAGAIDGEAAFVAFIADGVRINWGNAPSAAFLLEVTLIAGRSVTAKASKFTLGNVNIAVDVNTVGFEPDVLFTACHGTRIDDASRTDWMLSHGVVLNKASIVQLSYAQQSYQAAAASRLTSRITDDYGIMQVWDGVFNWGGEFSAFDAQGFTCTSRIGDSNDDVAFLALAFDNVVDFSAAIIDSPTGNGDQTVTNPAFLPQYVHVGLTQMPAIDTLYTDGYAGAIGISMFDEDDEYSQATADEDAQGTTDTQSLSDNTAVNLPQDDGTAGWVASFVEFNAEGWIWNFTTSLGTAVKWWYLAIEKARSPRYGFTNFQRPGVI